MSVRDVVIGLDLATRSGWAAVSLDGKRLGSGSWDCRVRKGRGRGDRWLRLRSELVALLGCYDGRVAAVAVERPFTGGPGAATPSVAWGLVAVVELAAELRGLEVVAFPPATVKRVAAGKGNATKAQMLRAMCARFGLVVSLDGDPPYDEFDALGVAVTALELLDVEKLRCGEVELRYLDGAA